MRQSVSGYSRSILTIFMLSLLLSLLLPAACFAALPSIAAQAPSGLISWWAGSGDATDPVGSNNGTFTGGAYVTGYPGQAFSFTGSTSVSIADSSTLHPTQFTESLWFNWDNVGTDNVEFLLAKAYEHFEIQTGGGAGVNGIRFIPAGYTATGVDAANAITPGWHHLAVTYSGSEAHIYVDGVLKASRTGITGGQDLTTDTSPLLFGIRSAGGYAYHGKLDEVLLFNRVLSAVEISAIYNAQSAGIRTAAAAAPGGTTATLNGAVNDNGQDTTVSFEYGTTAAYGSTAAATPATITAGSGVTAVSASLSGLNVNTLYHFRIKAVNASGTTYGADQTFTTADACADPAAPGVNWSGCNKMSANLAGANLTGANLTGTNLTNANLSNADLSSANLFFANLTGATLTGANLSNTNLKIANLKNADLTGATGMPVGFDKAYLDLTTCPTGGSGSSTNNCWGMKVRGIIIDPANNQNLLAGIDGAGVYKSTDSGATWNVSNGTAPDNLTNLRVKALVRAASGTIYAGIYGGGVFASADSGGTWGVCKDSSNVENSGLTNLNVVSLTIAGSGKIYAGTESGMFVSADNCATWTAIKNGLP